MVGEAVRQREMGRRSRRTDIGGEADRQRQRQREIKRDRQREKQSERDTEREGQKGERQS